jgi:hypothetical protein
MRWPSPACARPPPPQGDGCWPQPYSALAWPAQLDATVVNVALPSIGRSSMLDHDTQTGLVGRLQCRNSRGIGWLNRVPIPDRAHKRVIGHGKVVDHATNCYSCTRNYFPMQGAPQCSSTASIT